jgi:hypothetical protein
MKHFIISDCFLRSCAKSDEFSLKLQYDLAVRAVDKLTAVYGTQYTIGTSTNVLCKLFKQKKTKKLGQIFNYFTQH